MFARDETRVRPRFLAYSRRCAIPRPSMRINCISLQSASVSSHPPSRLRSKQNLSCSMGVEVCRKYVARIPEEVRPRRSGGRWKFELLQILREIPENSLAGSARADFASRSTVLFTISRGERRKKIRKRETKASANKASRRAAPRSEGGFVRGWNLALNAYRMRRAGSVLAGK